MSEKPETTAGVALVTGATRGIGRAVALRLARDGRPVAFCYHSSGEAAKTLKEEILALGVPVFGAACDVADADSVEGFLNAAQQALGPIDVLVNNAGIRQDNPLILLGDESWKSVLHTNLDSVFYFTKRVVFSMMKQKRGAIINMSSVAGVYGNPAQTNYSASKAGMIGFTKSLAKEIGPYGIRVNAVAPGWIQTDMTEGLPQKVIDRVKPNIPLRRLGSVEDVAALVSFLASDCSAYITAQVIHVDGGVMI